MPAPAPKRIPLSSSTTVSKNPSTWSWRQPTLRNRMVRSRDNPAVRPKKRTGSSRHLPRARTLARMSLRRPPLPLRPRKLRNLSRYQPVCTFSSLRLPHGKPNAASTVADAYRNSTNQEQYTSMTHGRAWRGPLVPWPRHHKETPQGTSPLLYNCGNYVDNSMHVSIVTESRAPLRMIE